MNTHRAVLRPTLTILAVAILSGAVILSSCGGGDDKKVDVDDWVKANCDIMQDFSKASDKVGEGLDKIDLSKKGAKDDVVDLIKDFDKERSKLSAERKKTGTPDVKGGAEVVAAINKQSGVNDKAFARLKKDLDKLEDGKNFEKDLVALFTDVKPDNNLRSDLDDLAGAKKTEGAQDVLDALADDPECSATLLDEERRTTEPVKTPPPSKTTVASKTPVARATLKANASKDEKWVIGLCNAVQAFSEDIEKLGAGFDIPPGANGQKVKALLVAFLTDLQKRSATLKSDIDKLGNPDGKDGAKIETALSEAAGQIVRLFDSSVSDAKKLNANDQTQLAQQLGLLGARLQAAGTSIEVAFDQIDRNFDLSNIDKIANSTPQCAGIR